MENEKRAFMRREHGDPKCTCQVRRPDAKSPSKVPGSVWMCDYCAEENRNEFIAHSNAEDPRRAQSK